MISQVTSQFKISPSTLDLSDSVATLGESQLERPGRGKRQPVPFLFLFIPVILTSLTPSNAGPRQPRPLGAFLVYDNTRQKTAIALYPSHHPSGWGVRRNQQKRQTGNEARGILRHGMILSFASKGPHNHQQEGDLLTRPVTVWGYSRRDGGLAVV